MVAAKVGLSGRRLGGGDGHIEGGIGAVFGTISSGYHKCQLLKGCKLLIFLIGIGAIIGPGFGRTGYI
jgi:hypothetical protein